MKTFLAVKYSTQDNQEVYPNGVEVSHQSGMLLYGTFLLNSTQVNFIALWLIIQYVSAEIVTFLGSP